MYPQNVTSGGTNQNISARSTRSIVLYPILKMVAPPIIAMATWVHLFVTIGPLNILATPPISIVWLWLRAC